MFERITKERLDNFLENIKELERLYERKQKIETKYGVHSVVLSKDKVTGGHKNLTNQELYALEISELDNEIKKIETYISDEKNVLIQQMKRLEYLHRRVLILYFIKNYKWLQVTQNLYSIEPDYEENFENYRRKTFELRKKALIELQKVSEKPFIEYKQLGFDYEQI